MLFVWGAYFCMGISKCDVVAYIFHVCQFYGIVTLVTYANRHVVHLSMYREIHNFVNKSTYRHIFQLSQLLYRQIKKKLLTHTLQNHI